MANRPKRLLLLGGLRYLVPVINAAHEEGYYVITCDYIPDNIAHAYSDEYHNVSIIDKEAVLQLARILKIDGIMSFAVDPGVVTAAYVAEQMGLPGNPFKSVEILQNKDKFRSFLQQNHFNVPRSKGYRDLESLLEEMDYFSFPVIIKPTDSAGSKGVTRVDNPKELREAVESALSCSLSGNFIVEEFIDKKGYSSDSDGFSVNGELKFVSFSDQRFDDRAANPYTPSAFSWPATMEQGHQDVLKDEIQRLLTLLGMRTSVYNIETRVGQDNKPYIMELSPRGGGNRLSEMLKYATGEDLIKNAVRAAVGDTIESMSSPRYNGFWAEIILHGDKPGRFERIEIAEVIKSSVVELDLWIEKGDGIKAFNGANDTIGTLVLKFDTREQLTETMDKTSDWLKVIIQ